MCRKIFLFEIDCSFILNPSLCLGISNSAMCAYFDVNVFLLISLTFAFDMSSIGV